MQVVKVEGMVIGETKYSESSKILRIITREYGVISVMSKGCRNIKNKLCGVSNRLSYCNFYIRYKKDGISTLTDADTIDILKNINNYKNIENLFYVSYILDLTEQVYKQSKSSEIYPLFISVIKKINEGYSADILTYIYQLKLLKYLGISLNVDSCSICGNKNNIITISTNDGGFICKNCYVSGKIYSNTVIKLIRLFIYIDVDKITNISVKDENKKELELFINDYYDSLSGVYLKSKDFLKNIKKINE